MSYQLVLAWLMIALAAVIAIVLLIIPSKKVPLDRRRIGTENQGTAITRIAAGATGAADKFLAGRGNSFTAILEEAGVTTAPRDLLVIMFSVGLAVFAVFLVLGQPIMGFLLTLMVPIIVRVGLSFMASRRRAKFEKQLDETLQMISGSLRAGYSLPQALATIGQEGAAPTCLEFARVTNEVRVGRPMMEALDDVCERMRNEDFFWVTQAIGINREVGGNLADVLEGVSKTIRQRAELRGQVKSLAADGQLSGIILMALPFVVALFLAMSAPKYIAQLASPIGFVLIAAGAVSMTIGGLWMRKLINIKY
ncbi:MAG: type II secretion system F family protein [Propionibacteriaceae bacterium]|jgi:tight adherence protein B|nr:type II secretion system F family protein [Propionibacteriaceae bacterium]